MDDIDLAERAERVQTRDDFIAFAHAMRKALDDGPSWWENENLGDFLWALVRWTRDMEGYYLNRGERMPEKPTWRTFADILMGASMYE